MRLSVIAFLVVAYSTSLVAEDLDVTVGDGTTYVFHVPASVKATKNNPPPGIPPTIDAKSVNGAMNLQITFFPPGTKDFSTQAAVNDLVRKVGAAQFEGGSVEKKTTVIELKVAGGLGALVQYTDADLVNVAHPAPGQFRVVGSGTIILGKNLANFTLLGDAFTSADYKQALALLESGFKAK